MAGKIYSKAKRCLSLREAGVLDENPKLAEAILVAVIHGIHVLYRREESDYYFIKLTVDGYDLMLRLHEERKLNLSELVALTEQRIEEENKEVY